MLSRRLPVALLALAFGATGAQQQSPSFNFSSVVFGNFQLRTDASARAATGGEPASRFDLGRAYLTFRFPAGQRAEVRVTTDVFQQSNPASSAYYPGWSVRLKYGYLDYDVTSNVSARVGMLQTVVIEQIESFWPRWLASTAVEQSGFFSSADLGASATFTLPARIGEAYVGITNGPGYASPENDRFKDVAARFTFTPFARDSGILRTLAISPWYYKGWSASAYAQDAAPVSDGLRKDRRGLFVGLRERRITLGAELDQRIEELESTAPPVTRGPLVQRTSQLVSGFAIIRPIPRLGLVGRYDHFTMDTDADGITESLITGVIWDLTSRVSLALDYQSRTPRNSASGSATNTWLMQWTASF